MSKIKLVQVTGLLASPKSKKFNTGSMCGHEGDIHFSITISKEKFSEYPVANLISKIESLTGLGVAELQLDNFERVN